jgi:hypothetical protein
VIALGSGGLRLPKEVDGRSRLMGAPGPGRVGIDPTGAPPFELGDTLLPVLFFCHLV